MKQIVAVMACLGAGLACAAVSGTVFLDHNGNGVQEIDEPRIAHAAVSDGLHVVLSDAQGRFSLPADHPQAHFVALSVPDGFRAAQHYLPIGENARYAFALQPWAPANKGAHTFIHLTDTEMSSGAAPHYQTMAEELKTLAATEQAAFIMHTGDICYERGLKDHIRLINAQTIGVPVFYGIGNHDLVRGATGEALFTSLYGPAWYSFNAGGTHYVVLPMPSGDHRPSYTTAQVSAWLANDLAVLPKGTPVMIFCHELLFTGDHFTYGNLNLLHYNLKAWIYGHWHINLARKQGNVSTFCTSAPEKGGIDYSPASFRLFHVSADGTPRSTLRYAPVAGVLTALPAPNGILTVNAYKTAAATRSISVNGKPLLQHSDWSWQGKLPAQGEVRAVFADGTSLSTPLPSTPGRLLWNAPAGEGILFSNPVAEGNKVFIGTLDDNLSGVGGVTALDAATGKRLWRAHTRASVKNTLAVMDGRVFAQDVWGWVYAFNTADGKLLWECHLPCAPLPGLVSGLTAAQGTLYAGAGQSLTAFDPVSGKIRWQNGGWKLREGTPDRPILHEPSQTLVQGSHWDALYASDAITGKLRWVLRDADFRFRGSLPAPDGDNLWVCARHSLALIEARSGKILKKKDLGFSLETGGQPLITDALILLSTVNEGLVALDKITLKPRWKCPVGVGLTFTPCYSHTPMTPIQGTPVRQGGTVYIAAADGVLYAVALADGRVLWKQPLGAPLLGTPLILKDQAYVADLGGTVHCVSLKPEP
mgnify:CR=1 FL=1